MSCRNKKGRVQPGVFRYPCGVRSGGAAAVLIRQLWVGLYRPSTYTTAVLDRQHVLEDDVRLRFYMIWYSLKLSLNAPLCLKSTRCGVWPLPGDVASAMPRMLRLAPWWLRS